VYDITSEHCVKCHCFTRHICCVQGLCIHRVWHQRGCWRGCTRHEYVRFRWTVFKSRQGSYFVYSLIMYWGKALLLLLFTLSLI